MPRRFGIHADALPDLPGISSPEGVDRAAFAAGGRMRVDLFLSDRPGCLRNWRGDPDGRSIGKRRARGQSDQAKPD
jgi:hypothetical protein